MTWRRGLRCCSAFVLLAGGCSGSSDSAPDAGRSTIEPIRLAELRRCMLARAAPGAPEAVPALASGYEVVQAYRACRDPAREGDTPATFRVVAAGFAAPAEGAWPQYTLFLAAGAGP